MMQSNAFAIIVLCLASSLSACSKSTNNPPAIPDKQPPMSQATPEGPLYFKDTLEVHLACQDSGSGCNAIYYTLDGTEPTLNSATYSQPIPLSMTTTLKYFAVDKDGNREATQTASYTQDNIPPVSTVSVETGKFSKAETIEITCNDFDGSGCEKIYYTLDGTQPTRESAVYDKPLLLFQSAELRFFAVDKSGLAETAQIKNYTINIPRFPISVIGTGLKNAPDLALSLYVNQSNEAAEKLPITEASLDFHSKLGPGETYRISSNAENCLTDLSEGTMKARPMVVHVSCFAQR